MNARRGMAHAFIVATMIVVVAILAISGLTYVYIAGTPSTQSTTQPSSSQQQSQETTSFSISTSPSISIISSTSSTSTSFSCSITGQPGGIMLRIISDANDTPVAGAVVNATNMPAFCNESPATAQTTKTFTTNGHTSWYSLNSDNNLGYSFVVTYLDQKYQFTARLAPVSITCATLYVPSGHTDVEIGEFQSSCPLPSTTSTSSSQAPESLTWFANYGAWNYAVTLPSDHITQGEDIIALFVLTNFSNHTQTVDVDHPLVLPTIYSQNGTVIWTWTPPSYNDIENVSAAQALTQQMTLPTHLLKAGQTYILSTYPGIGTVDSGAGPNIGSHLELNQTITVV